MFPEAVPCLFGVFLCPQEDLSQTGSIPLHARPTSPAASQLEFRVCAESGLCWRFLHGPCVCASSISLLPSFVLSPWNYCVLEIFNFSAYFYLHSSIVFFWKWRNRHAWRLTCQRCPGQTPTQTGQQRRLQMPPHTHPLPPTLRPTCTAPTMMEFSRPLSSVRCVNVANENPICSAVLLCQICAGLQARMCNLEIQSSENWKVSHKFGRRGLPELCEAVESFAISCLGEYLCFSAELSVCVVFCCAFWWVCVD